MSANIQKQEVDMIVQYRNIIDAKSNSYEKRSPTIDLFTYILSTTEVLKHEGFRTVMIDKMNEFLRAFSPLTLEEENILRSLIQKIQNTYGMNLSKEPIFSIMAPPSTTISFTEDLINAAKSGNLQAVKDTYTRLTAGKTNTQKKQIINYRRVKDGKTALHLAYGLKHLEIAKFLIQIGADVTLEDKDNETPVQYMLGFPPYNIALLEYTITLPNLDPEIGREIASILNKELPVNTYKRLGMGSYGLVVSPSFKTKNNTKVTKFMFRKNTYDEILGTMEKIKRNLPLLYTNTQPYPDKYTFSNIATNNAQVGKILRALNPRIKNTNQIYPLVMDNLGKAFNQITDADLPALAAIPIKTLLEQYRHLADTLIQLKEKEYIHGDIRETNIVINLQTGKITLIDFDWLYKVPEFKRKYLYQFYPHPPELIFAKDKASYYSNEFRKNKTFQEFNDMMDKRLIETKSVYQYDSLHTLVDDIQMGVLKSMYRVTNINEKNININTKELPADYGTKIQTMLDNAYLQIDSYGLGYSLAYFHRLLEKTKPLRPAEDAATIDAIKPWVYRLCDPSYVDRMSIETFRANIEGEYQRLFPPAPVPVPEPVVAPPNIVTPAPKTRGRKKKAVTVVPPVNAVSVAASAPANVVPVVPMNVVPVAASAAILPTGTTGAKTRGKKGKVKGGRRHTRRHTKRS